MMRGYGASSYGDGMADVYDEWYGDLPDDDFVRYLHRVLEAAHRARTARILELGVGTGRLMARLRALRSDADDVLVGIDSSTAMLERLAAVRPDLGCTAVVGDFSEGIDAALRHGARPSGEASADGSFDLVFAGYNTIFNVDEPGLRRCLASVAAALATDGSFVIDVVVPRADSGQSLEVRSLAAGSVVLTASRHDADAGRIEGQFIEISEAAGVRLRPWVLHYWSPRRLDEIAATCGLFLAERWADGSGTPFDEESTRHISRYVARRPSRVPH